MTLERILRGVMPLFVSGVIYAADAKPKNTVTYEPVSNNDSKYVEELNASPTLRDALSYIYKVSNDKSVDLQIKPEYVQKIMDYFANNKLESTIDLSKCPRLRVPLIAWKRTRGPDGKVKRNDLAVVIGAYTISADEKGNTTEIDAGEVRLSAGGFNKLCVAVARFAYALEKKNAENTAAKEAKPLAENTAQPDVAKNVKPQ